MKAQFNNENIFIYKNGELLGEDNLAGTGCVIKLMYDKDTLDSFTLVTKGDIDDDGRFNAPDARKALRAAVNLDVISDFSRSPPTRTAQTAYKSPTQGMLLHLAVGLQGLKCKWKIMGEAKAPRQN
ncbi:MAG TPA: hypothetical protein PKN28_03965 [Clostridiales bacterium]|nr:hypothetical protein [Clostridiales bacterium]